MKVLPNLFWWLYEEGGSSSNNFPSFEDITEGIQFSEVLPNTKKVSNRNFEDENTMEMKCETVKDRKVFTETFNSIESFLYKIKNRPLNPKSNPYNCMETDCEEIIKWRGTKSYEDAEKLITYGYTDILKEIKDKTDALVEKFQRENAPKSKVFNNSVGFVPNVPNALNNLPNSMILRERVIIPTKILNIRYFPVENGIVDSNEFIKCGAVLLSFIRILEAKRISIGLEVSPVATITRPLSKEKQIVGIFVKVKEPTERINLQKLCFPLANPSMLRRFGFQAMHTFPGDISEDYYPNLGIAPRDEIINKYFLKENTINISMNTIKENEYSINKLIKYINSQWQKS